MRRLPHVLQTVSGSEYIPSHLLSAQHEPTRWPRPTVSGRSSGRRARKPVAPWSVPGTRRCWRLALVHYPLPKCS